MGVDLHNVHYQMAKTVEDVLMRRTRAILLDARAAIAAAPLVAQLMATELGKSSSWINNNSLLNVSVNLISARFTYYTIDI